MITRRRFFSLAGIIVAVSFVGLRPKWQTFSTNPIYRMGGRSTWVGYRRVFGLLWEYTTFENREMVPRHCVRIGNSNFLMQIGRFKESEYTDDDDHLDNLAGYSVEDNSSGKSWQQDLRDSVAK